MAQCGLMRASSTLATKVGAVGVPLTIIFFRDFHGQPQPPKKKKKKKNTGPGCTILLSLLRWQQLKVNNIFYDDGDDDEVGNGAFSNTCGRVDPVCVLKKNNNCITFPIDRERGVGCLPASMGVSHDPLRFPFLFFLLSFCVAVVVFAARHISWS